MSKEDRKDESSEQEEGGSSIKVEDLPIEESPEDDVKGGSEWFKKKPWVSLAG